MANWSTIYPIGSTSGGGSQPQSFTANGPGVSILDLQTTNSIINCNVSFIVASIEVILNNLVHSYFTDFSITLTHVSTGLIKTLKPSGSQGLVSPNGIDFNGNYTYKNGGGGYANNGAVITSGIIIAPYEPMNFFVNSQSDWKLSFYDISNGDQGSINSWTLKLFS